MFKNKLYYNIYLELYFSERTINVECFHELILKKGHTKCMPLIGYFCFILSVLRFNFLLQMTEEFRRT